MGLFSSKPKQPAKPKTTKHDEAVLSLKIQRDKLKQYKTQCEGVIQKETELARRCLKEGKKKQALLALKKKKFQENLLEKAENQLQNIEEMTNSIEFAQIELKVFEGLKEGNEVLKSLHDQMKIEDIDDIMLDTQEGIQRQQEIEEALSGNLTTFDEEAIEQELDELEKLMEDTKGLEAKEQLPNVPTSELPTSEPKQTEKKTEKQTEKKKLAMAN